MKSELKAGDTVNVYFKDKWKPATFVEAGRKWHVVHVNGRARNSRVPVGAVKPLKTATQTLPPVANPPTVAPAAMPNRSSQQTSSEIHLDEFRPFLRLCDGATVICAIPMARRELAEELLAAMRAWREACKNKLSTERIIVQAAR